MNGKGSGRRPLAVGSREEYVDAYAKFDAQWDLIFGGKNMKAENQHTEISKHTSINGKLEAIVFQTGVKYYVELFEQSRYIRTVDCSEHNINWAEDVAENYVLGILS